jgi:hypothetical protein
LPEAGGIDVLQRETRALLQGIREASLLRMSAIIERTLEAAIAWLGQAQQAGAAELETGARRLALTLGRTFELALLARHAQWSLDNEAGGQALAAARRFGAAPINLLSAIDPGDSAALLSDG